MIARPSISQPPTTTYLYLPHPTQLFSLPVKKESSRQKSLAFHNKLNLALQHCSFVCSVSKHYLSSHDALPKNSSRRWQTCPASVFRLHRLPATSSNRLYKSHHLQIQINNNILKIIIVVGGSVIQCSFSRRNLPQ